MAATRALLIAGADVTLRTVGDGESALDLAADRGHVDIARALLEHGVEADAAGETGWTPLHIAAANGNAGMVLSLLCLKGAAIDGLGNLGVTPLLLATAQGHVAATQALLSAGADVALRVSEEGYSALDAATHYGHVEIVRALIEYV